MGLSLVQSDLLPSVRSLLTFIHSFILPPPPRPPPLTPPHLAPPNLLLLLLLSLRLLLTAILLLLLLPVLPLLLSCSSASLRIQERPRAPLTPRPMRRLQLFLSVPLTRQLPLRAAALQIEAAALRNAWSEAE